MQSRYLNWQELLQRVGENQAVLDQLHQLDSQHDLAFAGYCTVLIESGFTIPEAQELYTLLHS